MKTKTEPQATAVEQNESEVLFETKRNESDVIRIAKRGYKGKSFIDMRIFYRDQEGEYRHTKKGITVSEELFPVFAEGVLEVHERLASA